MAPSASFMTSTADLSAANQEDYDEFSDIDDYVPDINDPFSANYRPPAQLEAEKTETGVASKKKDKSSADLGVDEELKIKRKPREARVQLDENRLLSSRGIPSLRKKAKKGLKFKGKGHEYSDASRLLAFYQLWLDDIFPKAQFIDALGMVERMGHKKRIVMARMDWINEGKPSAVQQDSIFDEATFPTREKSSIMFQTQPPSGTEKGASERPTTPDIPADDELNDIYEATPRRSTRPQIGAASQIDSLFGGAEESIFGPLGASESGPPENEDELNALLAEDEMRQTISGNTKLKTGEKQAGILNKDDFQADMEAMAEMDMDDW